VPTSLDSLYKGLKDKSVHEGKHLCADHLAPSLGNVFIELL
jgi:hypothetical protein